MNKLKFFQVFVFLFFMACTNHNRKADLVCSYISNLTDRVLEKDQIYILVSDYGCSSCKEEVLRKAQEETNGMIYIIMDIKNEYLLKQRFEKQIESGLIFMDSTGLNKKIELIFPFPMVLWFSEGNWEIIEYSKISDQPR